MTMPGIMDWILILAVTAQSLWVAYLSHPAAKALVLTIPIPVGLGLLAVGRPVDITNVAGLLLSMGFSLLIYLLHGLLRAPIVAAIGLAAAMYGGGAVVLAKLLPRSPAAYWLASGVVAFACAALLWGMPRRREEHHRSPLPLPLKTALVFGVVLALVLAKRPLAGFVATFPMLGVTAAYETRRTLYTTTRVIAASCLAFALAFAVCRLLQERIGLVAALAPGLLTYGAIIAVFRRSELGCPLTGAGTRNAAATSAAWECIKEEKRI